MVNQHPGISEAGSGPLQVANRRSVLLRPRADTLYITQREYGGPSPLPLEGGAPILGRSGMRTVSGLNFKKPSVATDSELTPKDVILRYEGREIIGLTILHASKR